MSLRTFPPFVSLLWKVIDLVPLFWAPMNGAVRAWLPLRLRYVCIVLGNFVVVEVVVYRSILQPPHHLHFITSRSFYSHTPDFRS